MGRFWWVIFLVVGMAAAGSAWGEELTHEQMVAQFQAAVAENPDDAASWIQLGDAQWFMGYNQAARQSLDRARVALMKLPREERRKLAGAYYTAYAWLEYNSADWQASLDNALKAVKYDPNRQSRLVRALATAPFRELELRPVFTYLLPARDPGPDNRMRNLWWIEMMAKHQRGFHQWEYDFGQRYLEFEVRYFWREMLCRRDLGYTHDDHEHWPEARAAYELSASRSEVGTADWAVRHVGLDPRQSAGAEPMPFWVNRDGGYVTGSLLAYTAYACRRMLESPEQDQRLQWAHNTAAAASRCIPVYILRPLPWPWLWRAAADQILQDKPQEKSDRSIAESQLKEVGVTDPLLWYVKGHALLLDQNYAGAISWLDKATAAQPDLAISWAELGVARVMSGDRTGALADFNRSLSISPRWTASLHNRGVLFLQDGRIDEAVTDLRQAAELAPANQQILTDLQRALNARR